MDNIVIARFTTVLDEILIIKTPEMDNLNLKRFYFIQT